MRSFLPALLAVASLSFVACVATAPEDDASESGASTKKKAKKHTTDDATDDTTDDDDDTAPGTKAASTTQPQAKTCTQSSAADLNASTSSCPLFSASSPWNTTVAASKVDPKSDTMIANLADVFKRTSKAGFDIAGTDDYPDYGTPLYYADASTKKVQVKDKYGWWAGFEMPIPTGATPATGTDHHLTVWDISTNQLFEVWEMVDNGDGTWSAGLGATFDATGTGTQTKPWAGSARAYGGALVAGAIRFSEIEAGEINHALGMAYPDTRGTAYALGTGTDGVTQNIATHTDNDDSAARNSDKNIPEGARLRLKANVDIDARCSGKSACKVIGKAMATYGIYVVDNGHVATLYAEVLANGAHPNASWGDKLHIGDASAFAADDFEVLSLPAALTNAPAN